MVGGRCMEIIVGENAGFCYGVKRAVDGTVEALNQVKGTICCFGELVHNKDVVKDLEQRGIRFIEDLRDASGTVIIRAHGIEKESYEYLESKGIHSIDFTCPNVLKIHKLAEEYERKGYFIFLFRR